MYTKRDWSVSWGAAIARGFVCPHRPAVQSSSPKYTMHVFYNI